MEICVIIVVYLVLVIFMWKLIINIKFKIILMIIVKIKKNKGVWLFFSVWIIFERRLNVIEVNILFKIMEINFCVCWIIFGGVCISNNNGCKNIKFKIVKIVVIVKLIIIVIVKFFFILWKFWVLKCCVVMIDNLVVKFWVKLMIKNVIFFVVLIVVNVFLLIVCLIMIIFIIL